MDSEFDYDRMVSLRRSVLIEMEGRIKSLEKDLARIGGLKNAWKLETAHRNEDLQHAEDRIKELESAARHASEEGEKDAERIRELEASIKKCPQCSFEGRDERGFCKECADALHSLGKSLQEEERDNARLRECLRRALDFINDWKTTNKPDEDFEKWFADLAAALKEGESNVYSDQR